MAVPELNGPRKRDLPSIPEAKLTPVQVLCAQLLGKGYTRPQVARRMVDYIITKSRKPKETRVRMARNRIRAWEKTPAFRDAVYDTAVVALDLDLPKILAGVSRKARAGRVDAARLALEVTGRHDPKGEQQPATIEVNFTGIPRPQRKHRSKDTEEEEVEEAEWEEVDE